MVAVDAGVLAYAVNRFAPEHTRAARLMEDLVNGDAPWGLPWPAVHDFLGLVTHRHAVARPLRPADAWAFVAALLASPMVRPLGPTERHAAVLEEHLAGLSSGTLPPGLELAVVLREHGVRDLMSTDRGMRRFTHLSVIDPLRGEEWTPGGPAQRRYRRLARARVVE